MLLCGSGKLGLELKNAYVWRLSQHGSDGSLQKVLLTCRRKAVNMQQKEQVSSESSSSLQPLSSPDLPKHTSSC